MRKLLTLLPVAALALAAGCDDGMTGPMASKPGGSPAFGEQPVTGAAFTTTNPTGTDADGVADGTGHCKNGNEAVNCNIYNGKKYVWLSGGPSSAHLPEGTYFFAVLQPGGQHDPNDGKPKNLSDTSPLGGKETDGCSSGTGCGDSYLNRVFTITDNKGTIKYDGSHDFSPSVNKIRLLPYDDTGNPGGVYILAICQVGNAISDKDGKITGYQGYPVEPSSCKYDAFKVQKGGSTEPEPKPEPLIIEKDAKANYKKTFEWTVKKTVDGERSVSYNAATKTLTYKVVFTKSGGEEIDWKVKGTITVTNPNTFDVQGVTVTDQLNDDPATVCTVQDGSYFDSDGKSQTVASTSGEIPALATVEYEYFCDPKGTTATENTAKVEWDDSKLPDASPAKATAQVRWPAPALIHNSIEVLDNFPFTPTTGSMPEGRISESKTYTYTYKVEVSDKCDKIDNTASFSDGSYYLDASATATICGPISRGYTIGFWGNKNGDAAIVACTTKTFKPYNSLSILNLVKKDGKAFDPGDHTAFSSWLREADATNMSYMLSAQMAATWLNVNCGVDGKKMDGTRTVTNPNPADPSTTITITQALKDADSFLGKNAITTAGNPDRSLAEAYKNLFDGLNNGRIFAQP